jgi:ribosome maturation factor RimP
LVQVSRADGGSVTGRIIDCDDTAVTLDVDGSAQQLPYTEIGTALVQIEMNRKRPSQGAQPEEES